MGRGGSVAQLPGQARAGEEIEPRANPARFRRTMNSSRPNPVAPSATMIADTVRASPVASAGSTRDRISDARP